MDIVSKRLHISGLTPQITREDLTRCFSSFGTVKALDGLGKRNALGDPRPYAYLTIETTKPQLAKCLSFDFLEVKIIG
jgi:RNA recognition motif-containing protein